MTRFEDHLRQRLVDAADDAPRYRAELLTTAPVPAHTARRHRPHPSPRLLVAAAVVVLVGALAVWSFPSMGGLGVGGNAACSGGLRQDGRSYGWVRNLSAVPHDLVPAGRAVEPGCRDGGGPVVDETVDVFALPGLDPADYLVTDRTLYATSNDPLPASVRTLLRTPACENDRIHTVEGTVDGVSVRYRDIDALAPPYRLRMWVDGGEVPGGYAAVHLRVAVTTNTDGSTDRELLRPVLKDGARLRVVVRCDGSTYEAVSMSLS